MSHSAITRKRFVVHTKPAIEQRLINYLRKWPSGISPQRLWAWVNSICLQGGYSLTEFDATLRDLRDSGRIAFNSERFYLRNQNNTTTES